MASRGMGLHVVAAADPREVLQLRHVAAADRGQRIERRRPRATRVEPMKRGGPIRRNKPLRGVSSNADRRRRSRQRKARMMGDDTGLADFIRALPCPVCWPKAWADGAPWDYACSTTSVVAHIRTRGANQGVRDDQGKPNVLPLCQPHHGEQHAIGWARFGARHRISEWHIAEVVAAEFERRLTDDD